MKISVYNRATIESQEVSQVPHIIISISTPKEHAAKVVTNDSTVAVLFQQFCDICTIIEGYNDHLQVFQANNADDILRFVKAFPNVEEIVVHCDAGMSRSPGVAAALSEIINGDSKQIFKRHSGLNKRVYRMILECEFGPMVEGDDDGNGDH